MTFKGFVFSAILYVFLFFISAIPVYAHTVSFVGPYSDTKLVYLTFDDGPGAQTEKILDILEKNGIHATFFVVGKCEEQYEFQYGNIVNKGHTLALHSFSHEYEEMYCSKKCFRNDIIKLRQKLYPYCKNLWLYRFPGGSSNSIAAGGMDGFKKIICEEGLTYFDWNVDSQDGAINNIAVGQLLKNVRVGIEKNNVNVVLLHDGDIHKTTVQALPELIKMCRERKMIFLPISKTTPVIHHKY